MIFFDFRLNCLSPINLNLGCYLLAGGFNATNSVCKVHSY